MNGKETPLMVCQYSFLYGNEIMTPIIRYSAEDARDFPCQEVERFIDSKKFKEEDAKTYALVSPEGCQNLREVGLCPSKCSADLSFDSEEHLPEEVVFTRFLLPDKGSK